MGLLSLHRIFYSARMMDRREWLRFMAGCLTVTGLSGCGAIGNISGRNNQSTTLKISASTKKQLLSANAAGYGIWQHNQIIDSVNLGREIGSLSLTKSIAALAVTRAVGEGWLTLDTPLTDIIPEWRRDSGKSRVTVRMLVNQTSGFAPSPGPLYRKNLSDKGNTAISLPLIDAPGTRFRYGPASWEIIGEILNRKLTSQGSSLEKFVDRLTNRIGLRSAHWRKDGKEHYYLSTGAEYSVRSLGKLGHAIGSLTRGENHAGLNASIFRDLASPRNANPMFGAGIWWNRNAKRPGAMAVEPERVLDGVRDPSFWSRACLSPRISDGWLALVGSGGKRVYVLPEQDIVIARLGRAYGWNDGAFLTGVNI